MALPTSPQLQRFIEDELARAPLLIDQVLQSIADVPLRFDPTATSVQRRQVVDQHEALGRHRPFMVKAFCETLRQQVGQAAQEQAAAVRGVRLEEADELSLSLVDEDEVATDVALQRATVEVHSTCEYELRELQSFTSALVGDVHVAHETNPFRPEAYARALLSAVRAMPVPVGEQLALMRRAVPVMAQALRKAYAGACTRLESEGVEPGTYRTIVMPPGTPGPRTQVHAPRADLHALRDSMPVPLDMDPATLAPSPAAAAASRPAPRSPEVPGIGPSQAARIDQQLIELLTRLFDAILADSSLSHEVQQLLSRLQTSVVRVALRDPGMLDSYEHPVWEFMDRLAFDADRLLHEGPTREKFLRYAHNLADNMAREPMQDAQLYRWGIERLQAFEEHQHLERCRDSQAQIDALRTQALAIDDSVPAPTDAGTLDVGSMETVPAELMESPQGSAATEGLPEAGPGDWLCVFLQGSWRELQVLWTDARGELWLLRQGGGRTFALKRSALQQLHAAGLAEPLAPASLVQHAAQQVLRQIPGGPR